MFAQLKQEKSLKPLKYCLEAAIREEAKCI